MRHPLEFIENIQQKPEPQRKMIATALVIFFTLIIVWIWITTFSLPDNSQQETPSAQPSPFTLLWNFAKESFK